jgi:hypothetical protein
MMGCEHRKTICSWDSGASHSGNFSISCCSATVSRWSFDLFPPSCLYRSYTILRDRCLSVAVPQDVASVALLASYCTVSSHDCDEWLHYWLSLPIDTDRGPLSDDISWWKSMAPASLVIGRYYIHLGVIWKTSSDAVIEMLIDVG